MKHTARFAVPLFDFHSLAPANMQLKNSVLISMPRSSFINVEVAHVPCKVSVCGLFSCQRGV